MRLETWTKYYKLCIILYIYIFISYIYVDIYVLCLLFSIMRYLVQFLGVPPPIGPVLSEITGDARDPQRLQEKNTFFSGPATKRGEGR